MTVVSITLPGELLRKFDEFVKARGYYSRSEAFRDAVRSLIAEAEIARLEEGLVATTIMIVCDYARKDVDRHVSEVRHEFDDVVVENVHRHIEEKYCLEVFIAEGNYQRILDLVGRIRGMRGILQVKALFMPL
ncbi:MAG: CopG family ribbon-helix-helix protein [Candidatus Bathyarchaeia archaeon]